jgi:hypothetical protein
MVKKRIDMKVNTYACDVCGAQRKEANHWFAVMIGEYRQVTIYLWGTAPVDDAFVNHICGIECLNKFVNKQLTTQLTKTDEVSTQCSTQEVQ